MMSRNIVFDSPADAVNTHRVDTGTALTRDSIADVSRHYQGVRKNSITLAAPLSVEDWMLQSMKEASPVKWHLAHTSWFFETFILQPHQRGYKCFHKDFGFLFNSYYQQIGEMQPRARRGLLSRPSASQVIDYRNHVDAAMITLIENADTALMARLVPLIALGCAHEEQHQELIQTDVLHGLYQNVLLPTAYCDKDNSERRASTQPPSPLNWVGFEGGLVEKGAAAGGFAFDNESPRHKFYLYPFELTSRPLNNREFIEFIDDGGYSNPQYWLFDGWAEVQKHRWEHPLYWRKGEGNNGGEDAAWYQFTLFGEMPLAMEAPVRHISYFEAAAFASWAGVWLPTETEWEVAATSVPVTGHFLEHGAPRRCAPSTQAAPGGLQAMFGSVWEWTQSPYAAYPGFKPPTGAIGEYNGKFMSNQMVLRGGSSATPAGHMRASYRNFLPPNARWQFSGLRLAR